MPPSSLKVYLRNELQEANTPAVTATYVALLSLPRNVAPTLDWEALQAKLHNVCAGLSDRSVITNLQGGSPP